MSLPIAFVNSLSIIIVEVIILLIILLPPLLIKPSASREWDLSLSETKFAYFANISNNVCLSRLLLEAT